jgi:hypothetical protein
MLRAIILVVFSMIFIALIGYSYIYFKEKKQPITDALTAIPPSAAIIIESNHTTKFWDDFSQTSLIWEDLQKLPLFRPAVSKLNFLDELRKKDSDFNELIENHPVFISLHLNGENQLDFLFALSLPGGLSEEQALEKISSYFDNNTLETIDNYTKTKIDDDILFFSIQNGILLVSYSEKIIQESIQHVKNQNDLSTNNNFSKVLLTAGKNIDINVFINYTVLPNVLSKLAQKNNNDDILSIVDIATWTEFDVYHKPNALSLVGYTHSNDEQNNYLSVFKGQKPQPADMIKILPENTSALLHLSFSDFKKFQVKYEQYLEKNNKLVEKAIAITKIESTYELNFYEDFWNWIEQEMAIVFLQNKNTTYEQNVAAIFKTYDKEIALKSLEKIYQSVQKVNNNSFDSIVYEGHIIKKIDIPNLLKELFNQTFSPVQENYYTAIEDYIVFANSPETLQKIIQSKLNGKTLNKSINYNDFSEKIAETSNVMLYINPQQSKELAKKFLISEFMTIEENNESLLSKFDGLCYQLSVDKNDLFYSTFYLSYNPAVKQEIKTFWEANLDTTAHFSKLYNVKNHLNQTQEIFVQDDKHQIYLISNTGKILWKRKLEEKIENDVSQIDILKNNKLQLVFNTQNQIYVIDRNGNNVEGFPVKLNTKATSPLTVFDYDKNKNYRFIIACDDQKIYNYDQKGKLVAGWNLKQTSDTIIHPFKHFIINGKDYITNIDKSGNVYLLDRKGDQRLKLKEKLTIAPQTSFDIMLSKELQKTYLTAIDSDGNIQKLYLNDKKETTAIPVPTKNWRYHYTDVNSDNIKDYLIVNNDQLIAYNTNIQPIKEIIFEENSSKIPVIYDKGFGTFNEQSNEIKLYGFDGTTSDDWIYTGNMAFVICDLNKDGKQEIITLSKTGEVYAFEIN